jgi:hypothetical protein
VTGVRVQIARFVEKVPVVSITDEGLDVRNPYPQPGVIACEVIEQLGAVAWIDTSQPWGIESTEGETRFEVAAESLVQW